MFLSGATLKDTIKNCVQDYQEDHLDQVSYDLRVQDIIDPFTRKQYDRYDLRPGETVFIGSQEIVTIPTHCVGMICLRNSVICMGISYESPVYQPGHKTRVFTRIKNESSDIVHIAKGESMVSLMLSTLESDVPAYQGQYKDQFAFSQVHQFESAPLPEAVPFKKNEKYTSAMTILSL
ncbi:MAG: hypothetical protein PUF83_11020, partial [Intestinibaculum porci]|uniref:dCTP deaminase domain-containing protein n=1 Tax=Intestinibaculum porci TaxID=2487118 RepID=UPI00240A516E